jgi:ribonuclease E/ribonuclease G
MSDLWCLDDCAIEARLARRVGGRLAGVWHFPKLPPEANVPRPGDVFLARVGAHRPAAGGVFLDLGAGGEGFVRASSGPAAPQGSLLLASVVQAPFGGKLARLRRGVKLEGRLVSLAWDRGDAVSTTSIKGPSESVENELSDLRAQLLLIQSQAEGAPPGRIRAAPGPARRLLARARVGDRMLIGAAALLHEARRLAEERAPELLSSIEAAKADTFEAEGIEAEIEAALEPIVPLPGGGRLVIEMTQALTAIDVDASRAHDTQGSNAEAAKIIAFEIAAREFSGTIIIDFARVRERTELSRLSAIIAEDARKLDLELEIGQGRRGLLDVRRARSEAPLASRLTRSGVTHLAAARTLSFPAQAARLERELARALPAAALEARVPAPFLDWLEADGEPFKEAIEGATSARLCLMRSEGAAADFLEVRRI